MTSLEEIIKVSKLMDDLNRVYMNCVGTEQAETIINEWKSSRLILINLIKDYEKQLK